LAIAIIAVVALLILSLGKIDWSRKKATSPKKTQTLDDRIESIRIEHAEIEEILADKKKLKEKLARRFKRVYFLVRLVLLIIWALINLGFYLTGIASTLEDFLNVNQVIVIGFIAVAFLYSGGLSSISAGIGYIKNVVENIVYRKYLNLEAEIESKTTQSIELQLLLSKLEEENSFNEKFERLVENI